MQELKKIGALSAAKIFAMFGILGGLLIGLLYGLVALQSPMSMDQAKELMVSNPEMGYAPILMALGWWSLLIVPVFLALVYFVSGLIGACLYNLMAKLVGGVKINLVDAQTKTKKKK
jgi:xanthosine utilization system XapX-like protein